MTKTVFCKDCEFYQIKIETRRTKHGSFYGKQSFWCKKRLYTNPFDEPCEEFKLRKEEKRDATKR